MKLKQIFAAALLFCTAGAWAQTDVTSTYLTNAGFEYSASGTASSAQALANGGTYYGWTLPNLGANYVNISIGDASNCNGQAFGIPTAKEGTYYYYERRGWNNSSSTDATMSTTLSNLPVGHYELTMSYKGLDSWDDSHNSKGSYLKIEAVEDATLGNAQTDAFEAVKGNNAGSNKFTGDANWKSVSLSFDVATAGNVMLNITHHLVGGVRTDVAIDNLILTWTDPLKAAKDALQAEIDKAKLCDAKEGLAGAISTAEGVLASATTQEELATALTNLQNADKDAVLRYENGLADATYAAPVVTSFVVNGTFDSGISPWQRTGTYQNNKTANNKSGAFTGNFYENWNGSAQANKMYQTISNIPNGTYRLDIAAFVNTLVEDPNESQFVFANNDKTYLTTGEPTAYEVYTVVTNNQIEIGLEQTTATANWMGLDNVSLRYYGAGDVINDAKNAAHKLAWQEAKAAAEAAVNDVAYENVTGNELTALQTEIGKAEPTTADGYDEAAAALISATNTFISAKAAYDDLAALRSNIPYLAYATSEKYVAIGDAYRIGEEVVDAADATSRAEDMRIAIRAYYESHAMAENVEGATDMTNRITNATDPTNNDGWTWTGSKNNPASNEPWTDADGTNTHSYFDGGNWGGSNWTTTMEQTISLPAGKFLLTAKGRAATNTTLTMAVGEEIVELPHVGSVGNVFDRGWGDASVEFVTDGSDVTITVTATAAPTHEWFSISDFRLVRLELYTEMANAEDYENLEAAIATAKAKTLGFADGEYAPYNNVEAINAITAAEAIDKNVENAKADVTALISILGNWTANDSDVDAIFDGQFETTAANATSGDINLPGWTKVDGIRLLVKDEATDPGLAYTDGNAAVFAWGNTTLTYGNQVGYTLPLNKYELYELTLKVTGWRDGDIANVFTVALDGDSKTVNPNIPGRINAAEGNPFASLKFYLTPTEDNSTLTIYANRHFAIADLSLKPAVAEEITINEDADYTPAETYANVTLARTIKAGTWNTFVVPFDITNDELEAAFGDDVAVAEFSENSDDANAVTINFDMMDTPAITANKPVLLKGNAGTSFTFNGKLIKVGDAKVAGKNVDFVGTYDASTTVKAGDYFISANKLYKSEGSTTLKGTRAYIDAKNAAEVKLFIDGIETGISEINGTAVESGAIYNLAGQRVSNAQKGIYIVNGKKVIIK